MAHAHHDTLQTLCDSKVFLKKFSDTNFKIGNLANVSTEGFIRVNIVTSARFSDLIVGVRELSSPFTQELAEKQPFQV